MGSVYMYGLYSVTRPGEGYLSRVITLTTPQAKGGGGGRGVTQSMNVGNNCGTLHPPFLGYHHFPNWQIYIYFFFFIEKNCFRENPGLPAVT